MISTERLSALRSGVAVLAVLSIVAIAPLMAAGEPESEVSPLQIIYPRTVSSLPLLILVEEHPDLYTGDFYTDHPQALARLLAGEADILATGFSIGLSRYRSSSDLVYITTPVWGVSALMTAEPLQSWSDLAGREIYAPFEGSPIDVYIRRMLELEELTDQIEVRYAPFPQSSALVAEGDAAAAILVEPIASTLELSGRAYRLENLQDGWARIAGGERRSPQISVFAPAESRADDADRLRVLREDIQNATRALVADPAAAVERFAQTLGFPEPVLMNAVANGLFDAPSETAEREIIELYARLVGEPTPEDGFYLDAQ